MQVVGRGRAYFHTPGLPEITGLSPERPLLTAKRRVVQHRSSQSSCNSSLDNSPDRRLDPLIAFAPDSLVKEKHTVGLCPKCTKAGSLCFNCYRDIYKQRIRKSSAQPQLKRPLHLRVTPAKEGGSRVKPYFADLDLSALKHKLAAIHLKWPDRSPCESVALVKTPGNVSGKQILGRRSVDTGPRKHITSSSHLVPRRAKETQRSRKQSVPMEDYREIQVQERRSSLKPSPCTSYAVDLKICRDCSTQELNRLITLQELSDKLAVDKHSILKHRIDTSAAPWIAEDLETPKDKTHAVRFGEFPEVH